MRSAWGQGVDRALSSTGGTVSAAVTAAHALALDRRERRIGRAVDFPMITGHLAGGVSISYLCLIVVVSFIIVFVAVVEREQ